VNKNERKVIEPAMYEVRRNNLMKIPDYISSLTEDVYIEPLSFKKGQDTVRVSDMLIAEVSIKPFMNLIWIAAALMISGLVIAAARRTK
jgi:cytochrome c biogenesis factor